MEVLENWLQAVCDQGRLVSDRYRLLRQLGRGGEGIVYEALDTLDQKPVAAKFARLTRQSREVNSQEVPHANICPVYFTAVFDEIRLIVMKLVKGGTLETQPRLSELRSNRALALKTFLSICGAVSAAHAKGVLHLDLKPQNVLMDGDQPMVTDFGLSVLKASAASQVIGGTPRYMPPEQKHGDGPIGEHCDVFALGRVLEDLVPAPSGFLRKVIERTTHEQWKRRPSVDGLMQTLDGHSRLIRRLWFAGAAVFPLAGLLTALPVLVPPPFPARADWRESLWGPDTIPADAWNVALNLNRRELPRVVTQHNLFGCGQQPAELLDGIAQYSAWEHGLATRPGSVHPPDFNCVPLKWLGACGALDPKLRLCRYKDEGGFVELPQRGSELSQFTQADQARMGQLIPKEPCGDRTIEVHLDKPFPVMAVRGWHHGARAVPRAYRIRVLDETGAAHELFQTTQNLEARKPEHYDTRVVGFSAPTTAQFAPFVTQVVQVIMDTCTTLSEEELLAFEKRDASADPKSIVAPGNVWLYELETFAQLGSHRSWLRYLLGT